MHGITVAAPAKLNLHLGVGDPRPDGFHDIESLFLALDFGDTVLVETRPGTGTELRMDWRLPGGAEPALPPDKNIVSRAVSMFRDRTGYDRGLAITVTKRIPLGGGLGGGSSNAAATLLALNGLAGPTEGLLGPDALAGMGARLGSDVPFFVLCAAEGFAAARVGGRGELVRPLAPPDGVRDLSLLLVNPGFHSDTAGAFRAIDEYRRATGAVPGVALGDAIEDAFAGPPGEWPFFNDFLTAFAAQGEGSAFRQASLVYGEIISAMGSAGADFAGLSGSGSTCFGVFSRKNKAKLAKKLLSKWWPHIFETFACAKGNGILKYKYR